MSGILSELLHLSAITGLSVSVLVGLGVLVYVDPDARRFAIRTGVVVCIAYGGSMLGYVWGAKDIKAQWDAANVREAAAVARRDKNQAILSGNDAARRVADLEAQARKDQGIINALRKADAVCHPITDSQLH